jgi:hypothetical protein
MRASMFRLAAGAAGVLLVSHLAIPDRPATLCPLRAVTGIPCPVCGATTAAVRLGHGDLVGALAANPFAIVGAIVVVLAPLIARSVPRATTRSPSAARGAGRRIAVLWLAVALAAELWQLVRFNVI